MTKRVLSLLLTLVMVLSLCVPALAADEFEAEAPAEVVEEAPAAPEAPVEPEAEEPVEADEPVAAAIVADEPQTILVSVTDANLKALNDAITAAEAKEAGVKNGTYHGDTTHPGKGKGPFDCGGDFLEALEAARLLKAQITDGGKYDVDDTLATTVTAELVAETAALTEKPSSGEINEMSDTGILVALNIDGTTNDWSAAGGKTLATTLNGLTNDAPATYAEYQAAAGSWALLYQPEYRAKLAAAVQNAQNLYTLSANGSVSHASVVAAYNALVALGTNSKETPVTQMVAAQKADADDIAALQKAADDYKAAKAAAGDELDESTINDNVFDAVVALVKSGAGNITLEDAIEYTLGLNSVTAGIKSHEYGASIYSVTANTTITKETVNGQPDVRVVKFTGVDVAIGYDSTAHDDDHGYYLTYSIGSAAATSLKSSDLFKVSAFAEKAINFATAQKTGVSVTVKLYGGRFNEGKTDLVNSKLIDQKTITLDEAYTGPSIIASGYVDDVNVPNWDGGTEWEEDDMYVALDRGTDEQYTGATVELKDPKGNVLATGSDLVLRYNLANGTPVVGDYTATLTVSTNSDYVTPIAITTNKTTVKINVPAITAYVGKAATGYDALQAAVAAAAGYETKPVKATENATAVKAAIKADLYDANIIIAAAATTPNVKANRDEVDRLAKALTANLAKFITAGDYSKLEAKIAEAKALNKDDYTEVSWYDWTNSSAITDAQKVLDAKQYGSDQQIMIDAAVMKLQTAMDALERKPVVKTALETSIKNAEAKYDATKTYTDESKKAYDDALATAKKVLADTKATQSAVDNAAKALDAAAAGLKEKTAEPTVPTAPAGWSGWKQDTAGSWYYFRNGELKKNYWVTDASAHDLWYHVGADGKMDTGFKYITDKTHGAGWFMLQAATTNGMQGAALTGWQATGTAAGDGYFEPTHNGHYAECTWTKAWGDNNFKTGVWTDGQQHVG